jgi:predicted DNA-binding transcriptional regulator AlpA
MSSNFRRQDRRALSIKEAAEICSSSRNLNPVGALSDTGYIRQSQLIPAIFPFSSATLWRKVKAGTFPQPVKLGPRITAWRVEDIRNLIGRLGR